MSGDTRPSIGALIITFNEAHRIEQCLQSLAFCDERVVVDSFSQDDTVERACRGAEHVYQRRFTTHADQKNWGMAQLRTDWILIVDADERVPEMLAAELVALTRSAKASGYWIYRENWFFGRRIRHAGWGRDRVLRFLRAQTGRYTDQAVHEEIQLAPGHEPGFTQHRLRHESFTDWPTTWERVLQYSTRGAFDMSMAGKKFRLWKLVMSPLVRFFRQYLVQGGFREGIHGLVLCGLGSTAVFLRWAKLGLGETKLIPPGSRAISGGGGQLPPPRVEVVQGRTIAGA